MPPSAPHRIGHHVRERRPGVAQGSPPREASSHQSGHRARSEPNDLSVARRSQACSKQACSCWQEDRCIFGATPGEWNSRYVACVTYTVTLHPGLYLACKSGSTTSLTQYNLQTPSLGGSGLTVLMVALLRIGFVAPHQPCSPGARQRWRRGLLVEGDRMAKPSDDRTVTPRGRGRGQKQV